MRHVGKRISKNSLKAIIEDGARYYWDKTQQQIKAKENMKKTTKTKNQVIVVPTTQKTTDRVKNKATKTITKTKILSKPRTPASKSSTCAYYDCLIDLVSSPQNDHVKITDLTHKCKCSKEEIQKTKAEIKHKLVHELAQDYKNIGINLGKYVKADIVACAKELEKK